MTAAMFAFAAVYWVALSSLALFLSNSWRWSIIALALQYVGVALLAAVNWPLEMSVAKLVAGWMACAVLGVAISEGTAVLPTSWQTAETGLPASRTFRLFAASLVGLVVISITPKLEPWLPGAGLAQVAGGLTLLGMGLLHLGFTSQPVRVVIGLLTILAGFEIFYAAVETSVLVAGLMAAVNLGLALIGAYLVLAPSMEAE